MPDQQSRRFGRMHNGVMHLTSARPRGALLALLGIGCPAAAQTTYRCGSSYQDQPCSATQPSGGAIGATAHALPPSAAALTSSAPNAPGADARCHQRGVDAEKARWAKEGGRTLPPALEADATNAAFLQDIYGRRGTAAEVRAAVEQDCNQDLQRARGCSL